jgi:CubicO group peptidase (beta-lactamase class C family)
MDGLTSLTFDRYKVDVRAVTRGIPQFLSQLKNAPILVEEYLRERPFDPLGMSDTTFRPSEEQLARLAKSYKPGPGRRAGRNDHRPGHLSAGGRNRQPMPAGGLFSTAADVAKFCRMMS